MAGRPADPGQRWRGHCRHRQHRRDHEHRTSEHGQGVRADEPGLQPPEPAGGAADAGADDHAGLLQEGARVLAVDLDAQASLTTLFGYRPELEFQENGTVYDCLRYDEEQVGMEHIILKTYFHNLDLAPAGLILAEYETNTAYALSQRITPNFAERLSIQLSSSTAHRSWASRLSPRSRQAPG